MQSFRDCAETVYPAGGNAGPLVGHDNKKKVNVQNLQGNTKNCQRKEKA